MKKTRNFKFLLALSVSVAAAVLSVISFAVIKTEHVNDAYAEIPFNTAPSNSAENTSQNDSSVSIDPLRIMEISQYPDYPTGCESVSLYILLRYYDVDVTLEDIVDALPKGPSPYTQNGKDFGANPNKEFVGDPRDEHSYGVYAEPIAEAANRFKEGAVGGPMEWEYGVTEEDRLRELLDSGIPVIVWMQLYPETNNTANLVYWYDYETDERVYWVKGEHAVVVYGYDDEFYYVSDPMLGEKTTVARADMEYSMSVFSGMCVYYPG